MKNARPNSRTTRVRVYRRCNSGHNFAGGCCPLDGWSSPKTDAVLIALERLTAAHVTPSIGNLQQAGVSEDALARTIVVRFGSRASTFDAISPEGYVVEGRWRPLVSMDANFK